MSHCQLKQIHNWPELVHETNWSASELAIRCGVSLRTLERFFIKEMGKSPKEWLLGHRENQAIELLRNGFSAKEAAKEPVLDGQTGRTGKSLSGQSPTGAGKERAAVESLAQRTMRTNFCACVRDRRWPTSLVAGTDQREQNAHAQMRGI